MYNYCYTFLLFLIYGFIGWIVEIIDILIIDKKIMNRGFMFGPICPIYGVGILLMIHFLKRYIDTPIILFMLAIVIFTVLEYITGYAMEKIFKVKWWDYSNFKFNLHGRICLETTIPFGIGGMLVMYVINPFLNRLLSLLNHKLVIILGIVLLVIFMIDYFLSLLIVNKLKKKGFKNLKNKDNTDDINTEIRDYLMESSPFMKRILESFPGTRNKMANIKHKIEAKVANF